MCTSNRNDLQYGDTRVTIEQKGEIFMVFIKKYWYIILIIFLVICTALGIFFLNKKWTNDKVVTDDKANTSAISNNEVVSEEENKIEENKIETIENKTEQETTEQESETIEVDNQAVFETSNKNISTNKSNTQTTKQEQSKTQSESVPAQSNTQEIVQEPQVQEQPVIQQEPEPEPVIPDTPKEDVVEYKENTAMINNIKNAINNNVSEDMQTYGYNVVVDSSIVNLTNQFTFSEKRVADKIKSKFGTIRIYARDYYLNGSYVWTECYVI